MPLPQLLAEINKRTFNKLELKKGVRPVLTHVGRSSGATYRTPLDAKQVDSGYLFVLMYGAQSDWVQNTLASGSAILTVGGSHIDLTNPRVIDTEAAWQHLPATTKRPPKMARIDEYLHMDIT